MKHWTTIDQMEKVKVITIEELNISSTMIRSEVIKIEELNMSSTMIQSDNGLGVRS
jgi:hypothetical protein